MGSCAWASNGLRSCSGSVFAISPLDFGCTETGARHLNDDFDSIGRPSYQHLRPSMKRQDQYPCRSDGARLHCCFASAFGIATGVNIAITQATNATDLIIFLIVNSLLQSTHGHYPTLAVRETSTKIRREYARCCGRVVALGMAWCLSPLHTCVLK